MNRKFLVIKVILALLLIQSLSFAQDSRYKTEIAPLKYITPTEFVNEINLGNPTASVGYIMKVNGSSVFIRFNKSTNQILLNGEEENIKDAKKIIQFMDVPPRQIIVEVKIVEIDDQKSKDIGLDWQELLDNMRFNISIEKNDYDSDRKTKQVYENSENNSESDTEDNQLRDYKRFSMGTVSVGDFLKIIEEENVGKIANAPRIVTTNNKKGEILDGNKIKYVSRYSSYSNIYETQELTTGLSLAVTPSLGESGYLKMDVDAKLTSLGQIISGSPSETGQMLKNTVIVKDGEEFLLGGLKKTETRQITRKVPILGTILPYLFSRKIDIDVTKDILLILTPKVIDLESAEIKK